MILFILRSINNLIANSIDAFILLFMKCISLDISSYYLHFPVLAEAYHVFKVLGYGILLFNAAIGIYRFFFLGASSRRNSDRVEMILVRSAVAAALIEYGGYILDEVVKVASWSFGIFLSLDVTGTSGLSVMLSMDSLSESTAALGVSAVNTNDLTIILALFLGILILWNVAKLMLEIIERYLVLGVLVYTSPLIYPSIVSQHTTDIFRSWTRMLFSQSLIMSLSVFFLKLIVSGLAVVEPGEFIIIKLLMILAIAKIAARVDNYMNQLGLNAAVTGSNLMDDIVAVGRTIGGLFRGGYGKSNGNSVLGSADSRVGGVVGGAINSVKSARRSFASGGSAQDVKKAAKDGFVNTMKRTSVGGAVNAAKNGQNVVGGAVQGKAARVAQFVDPKGMGQRNASLQNTATRMAQQNVSSYTATRAVSGVNNKPLPAAVQTRVSSGSVFSVDEAERNRSNYGITPMKGMSALDHETMTPISNAYAAGIRYSEMTQQLTGSDRAMGNFMANEIQYGGVTFKEMPMDEYRRYAAQSLYDGSEIPSGFDYEAYRNSYETMDLDSLYADDRYSDVLNSRVAENIRDDREAFNYDNRHYLETIYETGAGMTPNASLYAVFDSEGELSGDDRILNELFDNFAGSVHESVGDLKDITVMDLEDRTDEFGNELHGGRALFGKTENDEDVWIYNETAYTALTSEERNGLINIEASDGRTLWTTAKPKDEIFFSEKRNPTER